MNPEPASEESELHAAVRAEDSTQTARLLARLLAEGSDPNATNLSGETPLHLAARSGHRDIAALLLHNGADANARTPTGQTARSLARAAGYMGVVILLDQWAEQHGLTLDKEVIPPDGSADRLTQLKRALLRVWIPITAILLVVGCVIIYVLSTLTFGQ